jgi:NAD(P)H dehydrogenase (quinone)
MNMLIVLAHPDPESFSHSVAAELVEGVMLEGGSAEIADLAAERFDPRFTLDDVALHRREGPPSVDIRSEQARIDRADALALVFPVYWWGLPGLLKGWIDRVFANGWAYDYRDDAPLVKRLGRLQVHLVGVGGADPDTYARHGYDGAMKTQIDHGIFDYCGARVLSSTLLLDVENQDRSLHLASARTIGRQMVTALRAEQVPA